MKKTAPIALAALALSLPVGAQENAAPAPSPNEIVASATAEEWVAIAAEDLLVMTLAPDAQGNERKVVIQLMPAPFSQGWVENIRTLARAEWYDGISVNRVQDNYVVQWGDPGHDNPESGEVETKPLPEGLNVMGESNFSSALNYLQRSSALAPVDRRNGFRRGSFDNYSSMAGFFGGWPVGFAGIQHIPICVTEQGSEECRPLTQEEYFDSAWPVHCYGMVGVGRSYSPDTGSGAELYTVIGHAPRHLDGNIALVGRIINGMEYLSSMPRGTGTLGFYTNEEADLRTPILSIRVASDLPEAKQPQFKYLSTEGETFARYAEARANRRDPFFIHPAGGADICNIPVPIRAVKDDN